jgi:ribosome-binding protein aMBF1 (putative translation factor)
LGIKDQRKGQEAAREAQQAEQFTLQEGQAMTIEEIGEEIRIARYKTKMTQRELAKVCKIDSNVIRRLELGIYVNMSSLDIVCQTLGFEVQVVKKQKPNGNSITAH